MGPEALFYSGAPLVCYSGRVCFHCAWNNIGQKMGPGGGGAAVAVAVIALSAFDDLLWCRQGATRICFAPPVPIHRRSGDKQTSCSRAIAVKASPMNPSLPHPCCSVMRRTETFSG